MYSKSQLALQYIRYRLRASNGKGHGVHSPFVYHFIRQVLNDRQAYGVYAPIELLRRLLRQDERLLTIEDFGAGSRTAASSRRSVQSIARTALKPVRFSQLLFRMVHHYQPRTIVELGTSLGITTAYLASGNPQAQVVTLEGAAAVAATASENFQQLGIQNIRLVHGNFDETLPGLLQQLPAVDFAFIDGNHRYRPTMQYFLQLLPYTHEGSILVLDDIHWSEEMSRAWKEVQQHPQVRLTIDLFFIGIVLFRKDFKVKQHFTIRF